MPDVVDIAAGCEYEAYLCLTQVCLCVINWGIPYGIGDWSDIISAIVKQENLEARTMTHEHK